MAAVLNALVPIAVLIFCGWALRHRQILGDEFWRGLERLTYYVLTPALLVHILAGPQDGGKPAAPAQWADLMLVVWLTLMGCAVGFWILALLWRRWDRATFTSVFQGGVRFNTFVGLAVADGLLGRDGVAMTALAAGAMIILINVLCVTTLSLAIGQESDLKKGLGARLRVIPRELVRNPLILACLVGAFFTAAGVTLPTAVDGVLAIFGKAGLPMALLSVGAGIRFGGDARAIGSEIVASVVQFVVKPLLAYGLGTAFGLAGTALVVVVLLMALPTAPSAYILARQMGGNAPVMARIISTQTVIAFLTLPVTLWLLGVSG